MKVLAICGSIRMGNTRFLVDKIVQQLLRKTNVHVDKVNLSDIKFSFCNGCLNCDVTGQCVIDDDMNRIVNIVRETDAFIFATPARWGLLSGEMKTFFDRLNPLAINEELKGKKAIILAVGQSEEDDNASIACAARSIMCFCINAKIEVVETVIVSDCYSPLDAQKKQKYISQCEKAGLKLIGES